MGVIRVLFLIMVGWIVWRLIARALRATPAAPSAKADPDYIPLIRCNTCGVHIPQPRAGLTPLCERCRSS